MRTRPHFQARDVVTTLLLTLFSFLVPSPSSFAGKNSDGKGGKGGSSGSAVQYAVSLFSRPPNSESFSHLPLINNQMQIAGGFSYGWQADLGTRVFAGYFYDPAIHAGQAVDLNAVAQGVPDGQLITRVWNLNDQGMIAVTLRPTDAYLPNDPNHFERAGLVDTANGYQFYALPSVGSTQEFPTGLNNSNDIALVVKLNDDYVTLLTSYDLDLGAWHLWSETYDLSAAGISDRLPNGDFYLIGGTTNEQGEQTTVRINLDNPGIGEVNLAPVQINSDLTYTFYTPSTASVNSLGDFVGSLRNETEVTRRGKTTTTTALTAYLMSDQWSDFGGIQKPKGINNALDFIASTFLEKDVLVRQDTNEQLEIRSLIDTTTAPGLDWTNPDFTLECADLTDRIISDDGDVRNDFPVIVGYERYLLESPYAADYRNGVVLFPTSN